LSISTLSLVILVCIGIIEPIAPSARKVDASPSRSLFPPGGHEVARHILGLVSNNIIHPARLREITTNGRYFGRVMMGVRHGANPAAIMDVEDS